MRSFTIFVVFVTLALASSAVFESKPARNPVKRCVDVTKTTGEHIAHRTQLSATEAARLCQRSSGELAAVETESENTDVIIVASGIISAGAWTSGRVSKASCGKSVLIWTTTGEVVETDGYTNWARGHPGDREGCVQYVPNPLTGYAWEVADCAARKDVICEF